MAWWTNFLAGLEATEGGLTILDFFRGNVMMRLLRRMALPPNPVVTGGGQPAGDKPAEAPKEITPNKKVADEAHELHAFLKAMSNRGRKTGIFYEFLDDDFWIRRAIWTQLPSGATKKLFDMFATSVVSKRHKEQVGETKQEPGPDGKPRKPIPIMKEWVEDENHMGPELICGLVWLAKQAQSSNDVDPVPPGTDPKFKGVLYVVGVLKSSYRLKNLEDDAAEAAAKAKVLGELALKKGDTLIHIYYFALGKLGWSWSALQEVLHHPEVRVARRAIDDAKEGQPTFEAHETFQEILAQAVTAYNTRPGWLERELETKREERKANLKALLAVVVLATVLIILIMSLRAH